LFRPCSPSNFEIAARIGKNSAQKVRGLDSCLDEHSITARGFDEFPVKIFIGNKEISQFLLSIRTRSKDFTGQMVLPFMFFQISRKFHHQECPLRTRMGVEFDNSPFFPDDTAAN